MKVLILAAGRGERLKPLTDHMPKPLVKVRNKPLLLHHLERLATAGFNDVVINVSWLKEQIYEFTKIHTPSTISINISDEGNQPLETAGGMKKALPMLDYQPFLVVNADIFTDFVFNSIKPLDSNNLVHLVLVPNPEHNASGDFGISDGQLKLKHPESQSYTYSGIGIFHPLLFENCEPNKSIKVAPLIKQAIANNQATAQLHLGQWSDVGTINRLDELNAEGC